MKSDVLAGLDPAIQTPNQKRESGCPAQEPSRTTRPRDPQAPRGAIALSRFRQSRLGVWLLTAPGKARDWVGTRAPCQCRQAFARYLRASLGAAFDLAISPAAEAFYLHHGFTRLTVESPTLALDLVKLQKLARQK
jgi:hypothetical protein